MSAEYDAYIHEHVANVKKALEWMYENLSDRLIDGKKMIEAMMNAEEHDQSKWSKEEYDAYDAYFYGDKNTNDPGKKTPYGVKADFNKAWLHHIHNNPHHWQHWVLINDDAQLGTIALEMPDEYIYEMIADWWTFSWKSNNLMEIFDWYFVHQINMILAPRTRMIVENILMAMNDFLQKQMILEGNTMPELEHSDMEEDKHKYGIPEQKKFPMPDAYHVKSAIKFFNYVTPKYEEELANAILARMKEYGMSFDDFNVGDENRFKKYIPKEVEENNK